MKATLVQASSPKIGREHDEAVDKLVDKLGLRRTISWVFKDFPSSCVSHYSNLY